MRLSIVNENGTVIHTVETEMDGRQRGIVYALALFLYVCPPAVRDAALEYILDSASDNIAELAAALGCKSATIRRRFDRARTAFRSMVKNGCINARKDLLVDFGEEDEIDDIDDEQPTVHPVPNRWAGFDGIPDIRDAAGRRIDPMDDKPSEEPEEHYPDIDDDPDWSTSDV